MGAWPPDDSVADFAARLRWIVREDYADEGTSSHLPLLMLAIALEAAAELAATPWWRPMTRMLARRRLIGALADLDGFR